MSAEMTEIIEPGDYINCYGVLIDGKTMRPKDCIDMSRIMRNIFLGSFNAAAQMRESLLINQITHILTLGNRMSEQFPETFVYKVIPFDDHPGVDISKYFDECYEFIDNALYKENPEGKNRILIHCFAGVSRSATIVIMYLMKSAYMSYIEATECVRKARHWIDPNRGFRARLANLSKQMGNYNEKDTLKYEYCGKILKKMNHKKTISYKDYHLVLSHFEEIFGILHPHTLDVKLEMEAFVEAITV